MKSVIHYHTIIEAETLAENRKSTVDALDL
jgi:hypothetical protein